MTRVIPGRYWLIETSASSTNLDASLAKALALPWRRCVSFHTVFSIRDQSAT